MRLGWILGIGWLVTGCAASSFREGVTPARPGMPEVVPWRLNRELLTPVNRRIEIIVEVLEGHPPQTRALDDLARHAARYGGRPATWRIHLRGEPLPLAADVSYVFVKYVGHQLENGFGLAYTKEIGGRPRYFLIVNQEAHRPYRMLMPERRLEEQTLIHEYGHLLGLPTPDHGFYPSYPSYSGGMHCVNPDCALSRPRPKAVIYNAMQVAFERRYLEGYCAECNAAIEAARAKWAAEPK